MSDGDDVMIDDVVIIMGQCVRRTLTKITRNKKRRPTFVIQN